MQRIGQRVILRHFIAPTLWLYVALCAVLMMFTPHIGFAQGLYTRVIRVNDKAITTFEIEQRVLLLQALGAPGNLEREARDRLIDERLQIQAAEELGISASEEGIREGIEEFAQRANTDVENFLAAIGRSGVSVEAFSDFVEARILWREVVSARFAARAQITDEEVDRAISLIGQQGGVRVLVSEIIIPGRTPEEMAQAEERATQIAQVNGFDAFSAAARNFSAAPSREQGGRIDWLSINELPPQLRAQFLTLRPGGVTEPLRLPNAVAVFQLRAIDELPPAVPKVVSVDYAEIHIAGSEADARRIAQRIDTCDDLYGIARGQPPNRLRRDVRPVSEIPRDVAAELRRLDEDEISTSLVRGNARVLLMLCGRTTEQAQDVDRATVRRQLVNQRITSYGTAYLAELRSDAVIVGEG